jgi:hypothetical protein
MSRFSEYVDSDIYLPGDISRAGLSDYRQYPLETSRYIANKRFKFQPKEGKQLDRDVDLFQTFLNLQANPERLFTTTAKMPDTSFGNLSQYMGV